MSVLSEFLGYSISTLFKTKEFKRSVKNVVATGNLNVGPAGPQGVQGPTGPQGIQGLEGPQGIMGLKGEPGPAFTLLGNKSTIGDLPATGTSGTGWIVIADGQVYTWNATTSSWNGVGQIVGPQGPQGIQGIQGLQGIAGPQGPQGIQGIPSVPQINQSNTSGTINVSSSQYTEIVGTSSVIRTLPSPNAGLTGYVINIKNTSTGIISIAGHIDNVSNALLTQNPFISYQFQCNGTTWWII
jgi:hypothetical protein